MKTNHPTIGAVLFLLAFLSPSLNANERKPNIIFILADDLGSADLGCYGQKKIQTPNIDAMAAEGMRFTQHYAGSCEGVPSRCSLLTGFHTGRAAIRGNRDFPPEGQFPLPASTFTVAGLLKSAGYRTACFGKWGLGASRSTGEPNRQGFDLFFGHVCKNVAADHYADHLWQNGVREILAGNQEGKQQTYVDDLFTDNSLEFIRACKDRPFFLYLAYTLPHVALQAPPDSLTPYQGKWPDPPYDGSKGFAAHLTPRTAYAAMVSRLDRDVGRLLALLKGLKIDDQTLVLFASDNGPAYDGGADPLFFESAGPLRGLKGSLYEGGIRTPLIARWPGRIRPASTSDHLSAFWDFLPTSADLVGAAIPAVDGLSYLPTLLGKKQAKHESLYWEIAEGNGQQAVRKDNWKAVRTVATDKIELFDLAKDPSEATDLAEKQADKVKELRSLMERLHVDSADFPLKTPAVAPVSKLPKGEAKSTTEKPESKKP